MDPTAYPLHAAVEERHWWFVARRAIVAETLASLGLPRPARLIELGSGTGGNLGLLARLGEPLAIEPDAGARGLSQSRYPRVAHLASLADLTGQLAFDGAVALDVLEHLDEPAADLRSLGAWLVPGAPLVVTVPAHPALFGAHDRYLQHRRRYTRGLLADHLGAGGFVVEQIAPLNAVSLLPAAALRAIEALRPPAPGARGMGVPPRPLNALLTRLFAAERRPAVRRLLPAGLSWLAVARWPR
jgi:SAM-dependent methyltransferase